MKPTLNSQRLPRKPGPRAPRRRTFQPRLECLETRLVPANVDVLSYHNDAFLSGQNLQEEILTPANVNATSFGKLFTEPVDGYVYAEPLYKANLAIPGQGTHNVAFVATEHDSVYALDADNPGVGTGPEGSLWKTSFIDPANGVTSVPAGDVGVVSTNIVPEVGITGTPVIDGATGTLYVVAKTKEIRADGAHYVQKLHALDIATGREKFNGPATIGDTTGQNNNTSPVSGPGTGDGAVGGVVTFNARKELQRSALQLANGVVYIAWASHEDDRPYHGWVVGYNAGNLGTGPAKFFDTAPNAGGVGIWQSGGAVSVDPQGNIYFAVGNGFGGNAFDPAHGNYAESVLKLSTTGQLTVADYFTPFDWQTLDNQDADLGSGGAMLLPDFVGSAAHPHLMLETGKSGKIYLIDRDNMGRFHAGGPDQVVQLVTAGQAGVWGNPAFLKVNSTTGIIYYHGQGDVLKGYTVTNGHIDDTPAHILRSSIVSNYPGTQPVVSANGVVDPANPTNGIVWELQVDNYGSEGRGNGQSILRAWNSTNFTTELYDSGQTSLRDGPGGAIKFTAPTVVNGHVLVAAQYTFSVFGLFPPATTVPAARTNLQAVVQAGTRGNQVQLTWTNPAPALGAAATGIKILRSTDGITFAPLATVSAATATFTDVGPLITGQRYYYQVVATNQIGDSAPSNRVDVVAPINSAVLSIPSVTSSSVGLSWTSVANDHYDIERSTDGVTFARVATVPATQTTYTDSGVTPGAYAYRIHAFNVNPTAESLSNVSGVTVGGVIDHGTGFNNRVELTANGDAAFGANVARLTGADLQTGSVFANTRLTIARFSTTFIVRLSEGTQPNYADGFTFVIQAIAPTALGQGLGGLGYQGIGSSVAIKFGTFQYPGDPAVSSTGIVLNGASPRGGVATGNVLLNSQNPKRIDLTYDGTTLSERITDTLTSATFTTSFVVNIPQVIGGDQAYVGFTGSTGSPGTASFWQLQDVGSWTFTSQAPLPGTPANLRVASTAGSDVNLAWDGSSYNETGFRVERSADGVTFAAVGTTTTTTFTDRNVTHGTYYYRVRAINANGDSDPTNIVQATVPANDPPPVITGITRGNFGVRQNGFFTLTATFTDSDPNDPHTAVVSWGDGSPDTSLSLAPNVFRFTATHQYPNAPIGTNFSIRVVVQDDDGGSDTVNLAASAASVQSPPGLVDWYTGDGYTPTTAADIAGNNPGTLRGGVSYVSGKVGNAFSFNGTDGHVKLPENFFSFPTGGTRNAPFGFTAWFKTTTGGVIFGQQGGAAFSTTLNGWAPGLYVGTDGKLRAELFWNGSVNQVASAAPVNDGQFHFVAISSDGRTESVYLDNRLIGTTAGAEVGFTSTYFYQLGTGYTTGWPATPGGWYSFRGLVDEVQFFNAALSPTAVQGIFNAGGAGQVKGVTVVAGQPPVITGLTRSALTINEGGTLTLSGSFRNPLPGEAHTVLITWGDGSPDSMLALAANVTTFSANHRYADEPASGNGYPIRVTVRDSAGGGDTVDLPADARAVPVPAGLVSWWTGDGANATTAPDIAGANSATLNGGVTYAPGKVGNAFRFDGGTGSYVNIPDAANLNVTTGATWDFWFQTTQTGAYVGLVGKHDAMTSYNGVTIWIDPSGVAAVQIKSATDTLTLVGTTRVNDGQFHHLALSFRSAGAAALFVDGQQQAIGTTPAFTFSSNPLRFGSLSDPFWQPLRGMLDEVQVFNRTLSAGEIQSIFNAGGAGQVKGVTVLDPPVAPTGGFAFAAIAGRTSQTQTVATFTDPGGAEALTQYTATIDWGDRSSSAGTITGPNGEVFTVQGSHLYAQMGVYTITVTIHHRSAPDAMTTSSANVAVLAIHFLITGFPSPTVAGQAGDVTVAALDQLGGAAPDYRGTVHFTSSDPQATLPADYTFNQADNGQHTFSAILKTAGTQTLTATDTVSNAFTGTQAGIVVNPGATATFGFNAIPLVTTAGAAFGYSVTARDAFGNATPVYRGTVTFQSSDPQANLPANYTFQAGDNGTHVFGTVLKTAGTQSLSATDAGDPTISGSQTGITVLPAALAGLTLDGFPTETPAGTIYTIQVAAVDAFGNVVPTYRGMVHFRSTDPQAVLEGDYVFTAADQGAHTFGAALFTAGFQSIVVADATYTAAQDGILITPLAAVSLLIAAPDTVTVGVPFVLTVYALDPYGNVDTNYAGTVTFASDDPAVVLPADYTFQAGDGGVAFFAAILNTEGDQTIRANDTANDQIAGTALVMVVGDSGAPGIGSSWRPPVAASTTAAPAPPTPVVSQAEGVPEMETSRPPLAHASEPGHGPWRARAVEWSEMIDWLFAEGRID